MADLRAPDAALQAAAVELSAAEPMQPVLNPFPDVPPAAADATSTHLLAADAPANAADSPAELFPEGSRIHGRYEVCFPFSSGSSTAVFCCKDLNTELHELVAVKVVAERPSPASHSSAPLISSKLSREVQAYKDLGHFGGPARLQGIPAARACGAVCVPGRSASCSYLAMQCLGLDVHHLTSTGAYGRFEGLWATHGVSMLQALQSLHRHKLVHCDVSPGSFCQVLTEAHQDHVVEFHYGTAPSKVYVVGLGSASNVAASPASVPVEEISHPDFASNAALLGRPVGFADDLESLGYVLLSMARGGLPWQLDLGHADSLGQLSAQQRHQLVGARDECVQALLQKGELPDFFDMWHSYVTDAPGRIDYKYLQYLIHTAPISTVPAAAQPDPDNQSTASTPTTLHAAAAAPQKRPLPAESDQDAAAPSPAHKRTCQQQQELQPALHDDTLSKTPRGTASTSKAVPPECMAEE